MYLTNSETSVSCGTGRIKIPLAQDGFDVSGLDISDSMLTQAKEKYSKTKNLKGQAEFSKADLRYFDLKKNTLLNPS